MFIHGARVEAVRGRSYEILNPANGKLVDRAFLADETDVCFAIDSACEARRSWLERPVFERADILEKGVAAVCERLQELAVLLTREQGKPLAEATAEVQDFLRRMKAFIELGRKTRDGNVPMLPSMKANNAAGFRRPANGVSVGLVAWNFPILLMGKKAGPALISGNPIIIKPALTTPLTTLRIIELLNAAGLPPGVLNCVTGAGEEAGQALVNHPMVAQVHLTGSDETGRKVASASRTNPALQLDLAGSNPMIVCADADLAKAVSGAVVGRFRNAGQACTAIKRLYVFSEIYETFVRELVRRVEMYEAGDGLDQACPPRVRVGPLHTSAQREKIEQQLADALDKGARLLAGGSRPPGERLDRGFFFQPTVVAGGRKKTRLVTEEVFGPVLPVFRVTNLDEAIAQANDSQWDLGASIWTGNPEAARHAAGQIRCRRLWVNRLQFGPDQFGPDQGATVVR